MNIETLVWECVKLAAQGLTALAVARLAVRWALSRFKQEKVWERRLAAQSDILVALAELRRVYGRWIDELEAHRRTTEEAGREHSERFRVAARKLEEAMPLAQLLLPQVTNTILHRLELAREKIWSGDQYDDYTKHYSLLDDAIAELVEEGRLLLP